MAAALVSYAAAGEVIQTLAPLDRDGSCGDVAADVVGVLVGLLLWAALVRWRRPGP